MPEIIAQSLNRLGAHILKNDFAGYDPYDALKSPLFEFPILRSLKAPRFAAQQVIKRIPINIRPLLRIPQGKNPVTYGLCIQAYSDLSLIYPKDKAIHDNHGEYCLQELSRLQSPGYRGACWGYDFDWEARYARIPAYTPTIVATGDITNALFQHHTMTGNSLSLDLCQSGANFVLHDLHKTYEKDSFCYSYSPLDKQSVFNATMKGARLLSQVYSVTGDDDLRSEARATVDFVMHHQNTDGSWGYASGDSRIWSDNFHTGYLLECLDEYMIRSGDLDFRRQLQRGLEYYLGNFFIDEKLPKYYSDAVFPIDSTAAAQSIITLCRFDRVDIASLVADWMITHMQDPEGYFYYRRGRLMTNKIPYMRWSNAWMFAALSRLLRVLKDQ